MVVIPLVLSLLAADGPRMYSVTSDKSQVSYRVVHKFHEVAAVNRGVEGRARLLPDGTVQAQVKAQVGGFDSGNGNRDVHMKEIVEVTKYPDVQFKGVAAGVKLPESGKKASITLQGELSFHGVTKPVEVPLTLEVQDDHHLAAEGTFSISLDAFEVERPSLMFVKLDDKADIALKLTLEEKT